MGLGWLPEIVDDSDEEREGRAGVPLAGAFHLYEALVAVQQLLRQLERRHERPVGSQERFLIQQL